MKKCAANIDIDTRDVLRTVYKNERITDKKGKKVIYTFSNIFE